MTAQWLSAVEIIGLTLLHFIWQGAAAAAVLATALIFVPRSRATVRYGLACLTLAMMAASPLATIRYVSTSPPPIAAPSPARSSDVQNVSPEGRQADTRSAATPERADGSLPLTWLVAAWLAGVLLSSLRLAGGWWHSRRVIRLDAFAATASCVTVVERLSARLGIRRAVAVLESARVQVPVVVGIVRPVVVVPIAVLAGLTPQQLEAVLAHELAHVRRHDYLVNLLQSTVEAVLFYHPATWWVSRTIREEREHCCDDLAVAVCGDAVLYARALATIESGRHPHAALAMAATGGSLLSRVRRLVGATPPRPFASSALAVAAAAALTVAGVGAAACLQDRSRLHAPAASESQAGGTLDMTNSVSDWMSRFPMNGRTTTVRGRGRIEFTDDDADVKRLDSGGYFVVEQHSGWFSRAGRTRFEARAGSDGTVHRTYVLDGRELSQQEGRRWLKTLLPPLIRQTGINARGRVARLLASGGPDAVLRDIAGTDSDWTRVVYFSELFAQADLDAPTVARALLQAGRDVRSDFELGTVLKAAAGRFALDATSGSAYASAARNVGSDFEQRQVLAAALQQPTLLPETVVLLLKTAGDRGVGGIESDFEMAQLLTNVPTAGPLVADSFFAAARTVDADFERRRVLAAVAGRAPLDDSGVMAVADLAGSMRSDFERAEALLVLIEHQRLSPAGRDAVLQATRGITSDHERGRVLSSMLNRGALASPDATTRPESSTRM
jgi:beta-lactamase regulating signal transducer with metallopeptidase domain